MKIHSNLSNAYEAMLLDDEGCTICVVATPNPNAANIAADLVALRDTLAQAIAVIEDFMPNIGRCVLQDYGRLNDVLLDSGRLLRKYP